MAKSKVKAELERLRAQLEEAQDTLEALRSGAVDALVVAGSEGEQIYTLRGADHTYRLLLQEMNEGAATVTPDGTVLYCNSRFAAMLHATPEKVIGIPLKDFVEAGDQPLLEALLRSGTQGRVKVELTFAGSDGSRVPVYCSVSPVELEDLRCLCLVATDLTEQKRNEEIVASERLARNILEHAVDVIVVCDEHGVVTHASRAAHDLAGVNVLQQPFDLVFPLSKNGRPISCGVEENPEQNGSFVTRCVDGGTLQGIEVEFRRSDGKRLDLLLSAGPLLDSQRQSRGCVFTLTDVTRLKLTEEALRQSEARLREQARELEQQLIASGRLVSLGEITASMAHEFNNPLGIIMGFAEDLLSEKDPSNPDYQALKIIHSETKRCEKIIRDLLQYARPTQSEFGPTDVRSLIAATIELVGSRLHRLKIESEIRIDGDLSAIHADRQQLEQVLVNLFLNAIDAMPQGGKLIVKGKLDAAGSVAISVSDTGMGIEEKDLPKIFQPFFSARKKSGLGLGLSVCKRIIDRHGGRIEAESRPQQGTTFRIYLPAARPSIERDPRVSGAAERKEL